MLLSITAALAIAFFSLATFLWLRQRGLRNQLEQTEVAKQQQQLDMENQLREVEQLRGALAELNVRHGAALQAGHEGLWGLQIETREVHLSPGWKALLGYADAEFDADFSNLEQALHPEDHDLFLKKIARVVSGKGTSLEAQYRLKHKNGIYRWFHSYGQLVEGTGGQQVWLSCLQRDISDIKQIEAAMMDSQLRYRSLYENAPLAFVLWDREGRITDWNKYAEKVFGWVKEEILGQPILKLFPEMQQELFLDIANPLLSGSVSSSQNLSVNQSKDDRTLYIQWSNVVLRNTKGTLSGVISLGLDITERKLAEEELLEYRFHLEEQVATRTRELQEAKKSLAQIIEGTPVATFFIDAQHQVVHWNRACAALSGTSAATIVGTRNTGLALYGHERPTLADLILSNDIDVMREYYGDQIQASNLIDGAWEGETWVEMLGRFLAFTATPLKSASGDVIGAIETMLDITERKQAEQELLTAKKAAEDAAKTKADFLANMSHEIRTPMNAILGLSHLALKTQLTPKQRDYLEKISGAGGMLLALVNDVLDFSKIEAGKLNIEQSEFVLDEVLINTSTMVLTRAQEKGLELRFEVKPEVPQDLIGDPLRLNQVLVNLLGNAVKFTEAGSISVTIELAERQGDRIKLAVAVKDTGIGMTEEQSGKLFQAFSQADTSTTRKFGGTGLGLIISKRIVELMEGEIWLESAPGVGTTFHFTAWCGSARTASSYLQRLPADTIGARVLVVDDDRIWCDVFCEMLRGLGLRAEYQTSAATALQCLQPGMGDPYRIVFIDWRMPDMDGIELLGRIREDFSTAEPPALVIVSVAEQQEVETALGETAYDALLIKPLTGLHIVKLISELLSGDAVQPGADSDGMLDGELRDRYVLLVDDIPTNQMIASEMLQEKGVRIEVASNGREALESVLSSPRAFDAVLMDVQMPEMDGYEATRRIRAEARFRDLPIIAMTAHALAEEHARCREAGMNDFITKPINPNILYGTLTRWVKTQSEVQPAHEDRPSVSCDTGQRTAANSADPDPESMLFPRLHGIDTEVGLKHMMNKPAFYEKVLRDFYVRFQDTSRLIRQAIDANQTEEALRQAHSAKGLGASIGALALNASAAALESGLKQPESLRAELVDDFTRELDQVLVGLRRQFNLD